MSDIDKIDQRLQAIRGTHQGAPTGLRALMAGQEWAVRKLGLALSLMIAILIAALTLTPLATPPAVNVVGIDKVYHFIAFAALIFPLIATDSRRWSWAVPLAILFGGAIELIQPFVGRDAEWLDFGADLTGVLAGAALAEILHDRIRKAIFDTDSTLVTADDTELEEKRLEAMRVELMDELRVVLREELAAVPRPGAEAPVGPSPAEEAATDNIPKLRVIPK